MTDGIPPCYNTRLVQQKSSQGTLDEMEENTTSPPQSRISEGAERSREHPPGDQTTALLARLIEMQMADMKRRDDEAAARQRTLMEVWQRKKKRQKESQNGRQVRIMPYRIERRSNIDFRNATGRELSSDTSSRSGKI